MGGVTGLSGVPEGPLLSVFIVVTPLQVPHSLALRPLLLRGVLAHRDKIPIRCPSIAAVRLYEYSERLDYAFTYGEELVKVLRSHGFKPQKGYTFDGPDSETDFAVLLGNLRHVLSPTSHYEYDKLFDLEHEYLEYHWSLNELIFIILKGVLNGTALALYQESARVHPRDGGCALQRLRYHVEASTDPDTFRFWTKLRGTKIDETADPAPQLTVLRVLGDKHQRLHPGYDDAGRVQDLQHVLSRFTFSTLALRIATVWQTEEHLSRLTTPPSSGAGGGKARADGASGATFNSVRTRGAVVKPVGDWKPAQNPRVPYLMWEGVGYPCVSCFRFWGVTDGHLATEGVCPYSCTASFAPSRAPPDAPTAPKRPTVAAWAQPAGGVPPAAAPGPPASRGSPSLQHAAVDGDGDDDPAAFPFRPLLDRDGPGPMPDTSVDDGDADWPALRSVPWIPPFRVHQHPGRRRSKINSDSTTQQGPFSMPARFVMILEGTEFFRLT
ncbi:hypothetical protein CYMTET_16143 [Cymbomonas tetramitiformis]|uniref:Uncharacterized protein n=1 Tax=Cymbomonas tetramitiformis TaxID=36881 RepID=A0AAE0GCY7_9CHLO|nr:hypothetical protein CYMTET_16143 [Cymbomonas tetramitiformis]